MNEDVIHKIRSVVKELPFDLRAEVIAAYMRMRGISPDDIILSPMGLFKRKYNTDVQEITLFETKAGKQYAQIKVNREGIYDGLPQAITHSVKRSRGSGIKDTLEMIEEVKIRRKEERAARVFFQPFENEFYQQQVELEIEEQNILKGYEDNSRYAALLNNFWQLPDVLDLRQKAIFIYLIPLIHKAAANLELSTLCYEEILGVEVNFKIQYGSTEMAFTDLRLNDGALKLGVNFIPGKKFFASAPVLEIHLGPLEEDKLPYFLQDGRGRGVIEFLNEYFLEAGLRTKIVIKTNESTQPHLLNKSRLGYFQLAK